MVPEDSGGDPAAQAESLVRRGLEHYGRGELLAAIGEWEHALSLQPEHRRARQYYDYVVEHFDVLAERFREVRESNQAELDVPFGVANLDIDGGGSGSDEYEVEVSSAAGDEPKVAAPPAARADTGSIDDGWDLDDEAFLPPVPEKGSDKKKPAAAAAAPTKAAAPAAGSALATAGTSPAFPPPPRPPARPPSAGDELGTRDTVELESRKVSASSSARRHIAGAASRGVRGDEETSPGVQHALREDESTTPGGEEPAPYERGLALSDDVIQALRPSFPAGAPSDETTAERGSLGARAQVPSLPNLDDLDIEVRRDDRRMEGDSDPELAFRSEADTRESRRPQSVGGRFDDELTTERPSGRQAGGMLEEELTVERRGARASSEIEEELTVERRALPESAPAAAGGDADEDATGTGAVAFASMCTVLLRELDRDAAADESDTERVRRRVSALIQRAEHERAARRLNVAVAALDLALEEEPESATAQKLIHRSKDEFCATYEQYIGDLGQVPTLSLPMHELASQDLDSRAVFLLSRIDGTFTFDEIIDVSGMSRLEALRHLAKLVLLGVLEVR